MKKTLFLNILLFGFSSAFCQPKQILDTNLFKIERGTKILYYVENSSGNNNEYLIPTVEAELKQMKDKNDEKKRLLFKSVKSLNYIIAGNQANGKLNSITSIFNKAAITWKDSKNTDKDDSLIVRKLQGNRF